MSISSPPDGLTNSQKSHAVQSIWKKKTAVFNPENMVLVCVLIYVFRSEMCSTFCGASWVTPPAWATLICFLYSRWMFLNLASAFNKKEKKKSLSSDFFFLLLQVFFRTGYKTHAVNKTRGSTLTLIRRTTLAPRHQSARTIQSVIVLFALFVQRNRSIKLQWDVACLMNEQTAAG